jgi:hypothetical protein
VTAENSCAAVPPPIQPTLAQHLRHVAVFGHELPTGFRQPLKKRAATKVMVITSEAIAHQVLSALRNLR